MVASIAFVFINENFIRNIFYDVYVLAYEFGTKKSNIVSIILLTIFILSMNYFLYKDDWGYIYNSDTSWGDLLSCILPALIIMDGFALLSLALLFLYVILAVIVGTFKVNLYPFCDILQSILFITSLRIIVFNIPFIILKLIFF